MSCGLPEMMPLPAAADASALEADSRLRQEMSQGVHAMAQPLTILQAALCAVSIHESNRDEQQRYLDASVKQVSRLSNLLHTMRDALATNQDEPRYASWNLAELIDDVLDEMDVAVDEAGLRVDTLDAGLAFDVEVDIERTQRALRAAIRAVISTARQGDVLQFAVHRENEVIRLELRRTGQNNARQEKPDQLNLSIAETNIVSQGGTFCFKCERMCILLALPSARGTLPDHAGALRCTGIT